MSNPKYFDLAFAENGDREVVPDIAGDPALISYDQGWTPNYSLPKGTIGAENVARLPSNGVLYDVTDALRQVQQQGVLPWQNYIAYGVDAIVVASDSRLYRAVVANTNKDPTNGNVNFWLEAAPEAFFVRGLVQDTADANVKNLRLPTSSGGTLDVGKFEESAVIFFRNRSTNTGTVVVNIIGNPGMQNIPLWSGISQAPLTGGELLNGYEAQLVFRTDLNAPTGAFLLTNPRASGTGFANAGICVLEDSLNSSATNTAATSNAVRLAALSNNIKYSVTGVGVFRNVVKTDATNNIIEQWIDVSCTFSGTAIQTQVITYPTPFPVRSLNVQVSIVTTQINISPIIWVSSFTASAITVRFRLLQNVTSQPGTILVHAIGE